MVQIGKPITPQTFPDATADVAAIKAVTDLIPDAGAMTSIAQETTSQTILAAIGGSAPGTVRYASPNGDDSDGLSWATAYLLPSQCMADCAARDTIFIEGGYTYDEDATLDGLICNVNQILIQSIGVARATITNTDNTNNGAAVTVTANEVILSYITFSKGEIVSTNSAGLRFNGSLSSQAYNCIARVGNAATHSGVHFVGTAAGCIFWGDDTSRSAAAGVGVGTAVYFENSVRCAASKSGIGVTTTGVLFAANAALCSVSNDSLIQNTTTGISLTAGASLNILSAQILATTTQISDLSGNATNVRSGSPTALAEDVSHVPQFTGKIYFVDGTNGIDTNDGISPATARATIAQGIALMVAGDAITVKTGNYTENIDLALDGMELWGEIGAQLTGTLTVSGDTCRVRGMIVTPAGANGVVVTGDVCVIEGVRVQANPVIAFQVTGASTTLERCFANGYSTTGFDISNGLNNLYRCSAIGAGGATRGYYFSNAAADDCTLEICISAKNATSSFDFVTGAEGTTINGCSSGAGDGRWVDTDEAQIWNADFHFADYIEKVNTLTVVGADTVTYNLFQVTGSVMLESIVGVVETALTGTNTDTFLDLFSANGSVLLTEDTVGANLGALLVGSVIAKVDASDEQLAVGSASGPATIEEVDAKGEAVRIVEDRTGAAHVATYVRFTHTCAAGGTGEIHWYAQWKPVSDDGWLAAV